MFWYMYLHFNKDVIFNVNIQTASVIYAIILLSGCRTARREIRNLLANDDIRRICALDHWDIFHFQLFAESWSWMPRDRQSFDGVIQYATLRPSPPATKSSLTPITGAESLQRRGVGFDFPRFNDIRDCNGQCYGKVRYFSPRPYYRIFQKKNPYTFSKKN